MSFGYIKDNANNWTVVHSGKTYQFNASHPKYDKLVEFVKSGDIESLSRVMNVGHCVADWSEGDFVYQNGVLLYDGETVQQVLVNRILDMIDEGFDHRPMLNFIQRLMSNPSSRSVTESFDFLTHKHLPITPDGCFLAYKAVVVYNGESSVDLTGKPLTDGDYVDKYTRKSYRNNVGDVVEVKRRNVDDDRSRTCSYGLHVGSIEYVKEYGGDVYVICKVDPADIVSVPSDHEGQKVRVCKYSVVDVYDAPFAPAVVSKYEPDYSEDDADDYDDEYMGWSDYSDSYFSEDDES